MADPEILVGGDPDVVAEIAAAELVAHLRAVLLRRDRASLGLSGGTTPANLYRRLGGEPNLLDWRRIDLFLVDERCVAPSDEASNYRLITETLIRGLGDAAPDVHRIRGELRAPAAAADYALTLERHLVGRPPALDAVVLGVGADGHTASLFPGSLGDPVSDFEPPWAVATRSPLAPRDRVSLSLSVLRAALLRIVLVTGSAKRDLVTRLLGPDSATDLPAAWLNGFPGRTLWVLDRAAAADLVVA